MRAIAETGIMGGSLHCTVENEGWFFVLRPVDDGTHDGGFYKHNREEFGRADVSAYIPNWASLSWTKIPDSMLSKSESWAADGQYKINVGAGGNSSLTHDQVIDAFKSFMT